VYSHQHHFGRADHGDPSGRELVTGERPEPVGWAGLCPIIVAVTPLVMEPRQEKLNILR